MSRPKPISTSTKVIVIIVLLALPLAATYFEYQRDLDAREPPLEAEITVTTSPNVLDLGVFPAETTFSISMYYTNTTERKNLVAYIMDSNTLDFITTEGYVPSDTPEIVLYNTSQEPSKLNASILSSKHIYLMLSLETYETGSSEIILNIIYLYTPYFLRELLTILTIHGAYIVLVITGSRLFTNFRINRWRKELHRRRMKEEEEYYDNIL